MPRREWTEKQERKYEHLKEAAKNSSSFRVEFQQPHFPHF